MSQMSYPKTGFSRRGFMIGIGGLTFAVTVGRERHGHAATDAPDIAGTPFNPWVSIAPSGEISIMAPATEMGQGSLTSLPLILAEELDADWSKVVAVPAPPIDKIYGNPSLWGVMCTAHSLSVQGYFTSLRTFGAQVRAVLLDNVARHWQVPLAELSTEPSVVVHAKSGRRIGYGEIVAFAEIPAVAPDIKPDALKKTSDFRLIGHDVMRVELPTKVNGSAKYAIDVQAPGMIYGAILRSPVLGGAPDTVDDAVARAVAGVIDVVRLPYGVGVLAETPWSAFSAKSALESGVTWRRSGKAWGFDSDKGLDAFAADARDLQKPTVEWYKQGDAEAALATAATTIEAEYRCHYAYHAQMEPLNAVASVSAAGNAAEVWCGTQYPTAAQAAAAKALGIPVERVKLNYTLLGGGFGRRGDYAEEYVVDAVLMAKSAQRPVPVKVMWTREDDVHNGHFRPITAHYLRAGLDASGKLIAYHQRLVGDRVLASENPQFFRDSHDRDYQLMGGVQLTYYDIPNQYGGQIPQDTGVRTAPLRGIGDIANKFVTETFIDEVALKRGVDPVQFRLELLKNTPRGQKVLQRVAEIADWDRKRDNMALGCAFIVYNDTLMSGIAEVSVDHLIGRIKVHNFWCVVDCGIAVQPDNIVAQFEGGIAFGLGLALTEDISIRDGVVQQSNFYDYRVARMNDVPDIHVEVISTDNRPTGVGQMSVVMVAPAVNNAVTRLTGMRLREAPMTPERVRKALGSAL
ncbi:MAG TPA: molybdopterin cofactor-binding domain-containing protein [Acetobacteraceae bacterium]|nr:molybdopterin cofactor-binding domain-containing protein [Acetobacteraceae bacterium]